MLTAKQEKFVQGLVAGLSQRQAYIEAGYATQGKSSAYIDTEASKLFKNPKVFQRYQALISEYKDKAIWTREMAEKELIWLKDTARNDLADSGFRQANSASFLNAIQELNKLNDLYPSDKLDINANVQTDKLDSILQQLSDGDD